MGYKKTKRTDEVKERYTDLVTTTEVRKFYEIWKKHGQKDGDAIYRYFGTINPKTGAVYLLDYEVVDMWYHRHITGTGLENELMKQWLYEHNIPFKWVSFMMGQIDGFIFKDREEMKRLEALAEQVA